MENNRSRTTLGPRPPVAPQARTALSRARLGVLETVERADPSATLAELAATTGLHVNTLREHLDALLRQGLVTREPAPAQGRGRPAWRYRSSPGESESAREYAGLARTLAAVLHRTSDSPVEDATTAGSEWGRELARAEGRPSEPGGTAARRQVVRMLATMGFDPQVDRAADPGHTTVRLTRCPLLDAAKRYPDVVCGVHLGIARGAMEEYDADASEVSLAPFAEPGACLLRLSSTPAGDEERPR